MAEFSPSEKVYEEEQLYCYLYWVCGGVDLSNSLHFSPEGTTNHKKEIRESWSRYPPKKRLGWQLLALLFSRRCWQWDKSRYGCCVPPVPLLLWKAKCSLLDSGIKGAGRTLGWESSCLSLSFDPTFCKDQADTISEAVSPASLVVQVVTSKPQSSLFCTCACSWVAPDHSLANEMLQFKCVQVMLWVRVHIDE